MLPRGSHDLFIPTLCAMYTSSRDYSNAPCIVISVPICMLPNHICTQDMLPRKPSLSAWLGKHAISTMLELSQMAGFYVVTRRNATSACFSDMFPPGAKLCVQRGDVGNPRFIYMMWSEMPADVVPEVIRLGACRSAVKIIGCLPARTGERYFR
jgi:hypothetical protein